MKKDRVVYFDYLKIIAALAVIMIHIASENWYTIDVESTKWFCLNFYDSIARFGVPVFVMISGALFLDKKVKISEIYSKYILRLVIAFIFGV